MKPLTRPLLSLALGVALAAAACGTTTSDAVNTSSSDATDRSTDSVDTPSSDPAPTSPGAVATSPSGGNNAAPAPRVYPEVRIPAGTWLPLVLTSPVGSDTSAVEDAVTAELTETITIDGRDVLPAGAQLIGVVTGVDGAGRVAGRARVAFRFTSLRTGDQLYEVEAAPLLQLAPAATWEDAVSVGRGADTGAISRGLLVGEVSGADGVADGAADDAADGAGDDAADGAGRGAVLGTRGKEVRLGLGADASTELIAPLTVRAPIN